MILKNRRQNRRFSLFLCGFLAVASLSAVLLYADENEFTTSASNWDIPLVLFNALLGFSGELDWFESPTRRVKVSFIRIAQAAWAPLLKKWAKRSMGAAVINANFRNSQANYRFWNPNTALTYKYDGRYCTFKSTKTSPTESFSRIYLMCSSRLGSYTSMI